MSTTIKVVIGIGATAALIYALYKLIKGNTRVAIVSGGEPTIESGSDSGSGS